MYWVSIFKLYFRVIYQTLKHKPHILQVKMRNIEEKKIRCLCKLPMERVLGLRLSATAMHTFSHTASFCDSYHNSVFLVCSCDNRWQEKICFSKCTAWNGWGSGYWSDSHVGLGDFLWKSHFQKHIKNICIQSWLLKIRKVENHWSIWLDKNTPISCYVQYTYLASTLTVQFSSSVHTGEPFILQTIVNLFPCITSLFHQWSGPGSTLNTLLLTLTVDTR